MSAGEERTVNLDDLVDGLEVEQLDALLHELDSPPYEALNVAKDGFHVGDGSVEVVDDRAAFFVVARDVAEFAKDVFRELFVDEFIHFEFVTPAEGCDEHGVGILDVQVAKDESVILRE